MILGSTKSPWLRAELVTLFPEMFAALSGYGVTGRADKNGLIKLGFCNPRDYTQDVHRTVDDRPYGGGPGMVMLIEPLLAAVSEAKSRLTDAGIQRPKVVYVSPQGRPFNQAQAKTLSNMGGVILVCGRYEGVDERFIELAVDEEWSIGDYVVSGGELPAMMMLDAAIRLMPGALGHENSAQEDSFAEGLLDCPHFTRPEVYGDRAVPKILLSGNHQAIRRWRLKQSLGRTWQRRREILNEKGLSAEEQALLREFLAEHGSA